MEILYKQTGTKADLLLKEELEITGIYQQKSF